MSAHPLVKSARLRHPWVAGGPLAGGCAGLSVPVFGRGTTVSSGGVRIPAAVAGRFAVLRLPLVSQTESVDA
jgi:hypothetical protein